MSEKDSGSLPDIPANRGGCGESSGIEIDGLFTASLEATADGILVVDNHGRLVLSNSRFAEMWRVPEELIRERDDLKIREFVMNQLVDPPAYIEKIRVLYGRKDEEIDELVFKDGRIFERFSAPLVIGGRIAGRVWSFRDITAYRDAQRRLEHSEEKYRDLVENANSIILRWDINGIITFINEYGQRLLGFSSEEIVGRSVLGTIVADRESTGRDLVSMIEGIKDRPEEFIYNENENVTKDGRSVWISWSNKPIYNEAGRLVGILSIGNDITERKKLEQQLFQAQKMEAVGQLAGGIAHDFNNMLMVINGYCELLLDELQGDSAVRREVEQIKATSSQAAALTRQLLAFGRRQVAQPKLINLNSLLQNIQNMIRRLIGDSRELEIDSASEPLYIYADPIQVEQVVLNLAANARDAMPGGGRLIIETRAADVGELRSDELYMVNPGGYVLCSVRDTGIGMSKETLAHIFEPFFTTKEPAKGTGLGLSTVYGIVKQNEGYVFAHSEPGRGSAFTVYFPRIGEEELIGSEEAQVSEARLRGRERILLVESEAKVRRYTKRVLQKYGYTVTAASSAADALALWKILHSKIDLLCTTVTLSDRPGTGLAENIRNMRPGLPVLLIGESEDWEPAARLELISKPFTSQILLRKIRKLLDG